MAGKRYDGERGRGEGLIFWRRRRRGGVSFSPPPFSSFLVSFEVPLLLLLERRFY